MNRKIASTSKANSLIAKKINVSLLDFSFFYKFPLYNTIYSHWPSHLPPLPLLNFFFFAKKRMSTFRQIFDIQEQICYVQCAYCATFLLVIHSIYVSMDHFASALILMWLLFDHISKLSPPILFRFLLMQVSVPFRSLSMVVTVRCGHCTSLLSVNMKIASFLPLNLFGSLNQDAQVPTKISSLSLSHSFFFFFLLFKKK